MVRVAIMKFGMKRIFFVVNKYPNYIEPNVCVFIQQLVWTIADNGIECSIICPMPINFDSRYLKFPDERIETTENGSVVKIYHPKYISAGQAGKFLQKFRVAFTTFFYEKAVSKVIKKVEKPDVLYAHFLCPSGVAVARIGKKYQIPSFVAHGESTYSGDEKYGNKKLANELQSLTGMIAVSSRNKDLCVNAGIIPENKAKVFPNGFRKERFYLLDKSEARKHFGFPEDVFLVGFCGSFDERKGILRLEEAVEQIEDVYFACAGKGALMPKSKKCILSKPVNNSELVWFYNAIDVFVLPTRDEGCCNAIVEAIACGCPIISANKSFNIDICDETNSILVDPDNIDEIKRAIIMIKNDKELIERLKRGSILKSKELTLERRAKNIVAFLDEMKEKAK